MCDTKPFTKASSLLMDQDFMLSLNSKLLDTMTCLLMLQKQNIDGLTSANSKKTQRLLSKVQNDPAIVKRLNLLTQMKSSEPQVSRTPSVTSKAKRNIESLNIDICNEDDGLMKKLRLEDGQAKEAGANEGILSDTNASLTSSGKKFFEEDSLDAPSELEVKKNSGMFSPGRGAFTSFKLNHKL